MSQGGEFLHFHLGFLEGMGRGIRPSFFRSKVTVAPTGRVSLMVTWNPTERLAPVLKEMGKGWTLTISKEPGVGDPSQNPNSTSSILTLLAATNPKIERVAKSFIISIYSSQV